jgi:hypothetical protein
MRRRLKAHASTLLLGICLCNRRRLQQLSSISSHAIGHYTLTDIVMDAKMFRERMRKEIVEKLQAGASFGNRLLLNSLCIYVVCSLNSD